MVGSSAIVFTYSLFNWINNYQQSCSEQSIGMKGQKYPQQWLGTQEQEVGQEQESYINENFQIKPFQFSGMDKKNRKVITLSKYDPKNKHRTVHPGLNIQGMCRNQTCAVFERMVWVPRHYGTFHIGTEIHELVCPICQQELFPETVKNLGYSRASISIQGKKLGQNGKTAWSDNQTEGKLIKFEGYDGNSCMWHFLKITAKEI